MALALVPAATRIAQYATAKTPKTATIDHDHPLPTPRITVTSATTKQRVSDTTCPAGDDQPQTESVIA